MMSLSKMKKIKRILSFFSHVHFFFKKLSKFLIVLEEEEEKKRVEECLDCKQQKQIAIGIGNQKTIKLEKKK